jgi:hypothetical protein
MSLQCLSRGALALTVCLAWSCESETPKPQAPQEGHTAGVLFTDAPWSETTPLSTSFAIKGLRELYVHTTWEELPGSHVELRKYYAPSGKLYYQRWVAATTESPTPIAYEGPTDLPHTRTAQVAQRLEDGQFRVTDYLEVEGTWISEHKLVGEWRMDVYVQGQSTPAGSGTFSLE